VGHRARFAVHGMMAALVRIFSDLFSALLAQIIAVWINPLWAQVLISTCAHQIIWSWYTGRWRVGCYNWYSEEGTGRCRCTKCNSPPVNGHVPITVLLYSGSLLCSFNVPVKGLNLKYDFYANCEHQTRNCI